MKGKRSCKRYVVDTNVIIRLGSFTQEDLLLSTSCSLAESHSDEAQFRLELLMNQNRLLIIDPADEFVKKIESAAQESGESSNLSMVDISLLALALQEEIPVISDDYAIQNLAEIMKIAHQSFQQDGIQVKRKYFFRCPGCGATYQEDLGNCGICDTPLKRKVR